MSSVRAALLRGIERTLMSLRPRRLPAVSPPVTFTDETGREIDLRAYRETDDEALVAMYDRFDTSHRAQGIPPLGESAVRSWLDGILDGSDVLAFHDGRAVGHVSFVPAETGHELAIFVHQDYQNAGIGSHLLAAGLDHAREEAVQRVWLSVERRNRRAKRLYRRAGFSTVDPQGTVQRMSRFL
jgi:ribosomal protein S18 acetylase RimI-like enzyme